jgi:phosphatidylserine/phosphatidylglycerophosphate/cardiolipin synthase-like enzyme
MSRSNRPTCFALGGTVVAATLALIVVVYRSISGAGPLIDLVSTPPAGATEPAAGGAAWFSVYFTNPEDPGARSLRGGPDAALAAAIDDARLSVDVAIYDLDLWSVRDALIDAHRRGVAVRVVAESDNLDEREMESLVEEGIPVLGDRQEALMHHKFVVIDRLEVWTGSMNFTVNGAYRNDNNLVRIRSSRLAESYLVEFEEMFVDDLFGAASPADTPHQALQVEGTPIEVYFSPDDGTAARLLALIAGAQERVEFLAFSFTSDELAEALLGRALAGVEVAGVMEERQFHSNVGTEYGRLRSAGLDVHLDGNPDSMHHKVIIIDGEIVITGSYNFSASAENRNDENTLIIHDPAVAALFQAEFVQVLARAQP